jgi:hypothetical protein
MSDSSVRVASFEITGMTKEQRQRWRDISDACRDVVNCIWQTWLIWHVENRSREKIVDYLARLREWHEAKDGRRSKPTCDVSAVNAECMKRIYRAVVESFPQIASRPLTLLIASTTGKIKHMKSATGQLSGWMSILLYRQSLPSTTKRNPIPFDVRNARFEPPPPDDAAAHWTLHVRVDRFMVPSKNGKLKAASTEDALQLWSKGRRVAGQVAILKKVACGEFKFRGSSVVYDESSRKWFVRVCYSSPRDPVPGLDANKVAFLRPAVMGAKNRDGREWSHPFNLRISGRRRAPGGDGACIASVRRQVFGERLARQNGYRFATRANKGHGRARALKPIWHLERRWKDFVKSFNYAVASDVVKQCVASGTGKLVYFQPGGSVRDTRFLSMAGKRPGQHDSSAWDYFQIGSRLQTLCGDVGIEFVWRKPVEKSSSFARRAG